MSRHDSGHSSYELNNKHKTETNDWTTRENENTGTSHHYGDVWPYRHTPPWRVSVRVPIKHSQSCSGCPKPQRNAQSTNVLDDLAGSRDLLRRVTLRMPHSESSSNAITLIEATTPASFVCILKGSPPCNIDFDTDSNRIPDELDVAELSF